MSGVRTANWSRALEQHYVVSLRLENVLRQREIEVRAAGLLDPRSLIR